MRRQSELQASEKRLRIVRAAADIFVRYGFARTSVADIAKAACVHRPVVYGHFPGGKDELFEAYLLARAQSAIDRYKQEIVKFKTVREKIFCCALEWCTESFTLTELHPDASDSYDICYPAVRKMYSVLALFYAELIREAVDQSSLNMSAEQFAELFVFSLRGVRRIPNSLDELRDVVGRQVDVFLAAASNHAGADR